MFNFYIYWIYSISNILWAQNQNIYLEIQDLKFMYVIMIWNNSKLNAYKKVPNFFVIRTRCKIYDYPCIILLYDSKFKIANLRK